MRRVLFRWRSVTVWSYPAMLYVGLTFGVVASNIAAHAAGLDPLRVYIATIVLIVPALIGARLLFVASEWRYYRRNLRRIWDRTEGGSMMFGAVPMMLLCSVPLLRALHISFGAFWDVSTFTILVGMIFTRVGCLLNGCCSGRATRSWFGIRLPNTQRSLAAASAHAGAGGDLRRPAVGSRSGHVAPHAISGRVVPAHHVDLRERAVGAGAGP